MNTNSGVAYELGSDLTGEAVLGEALKPLAPMLTELRDEQKRRATEDELAAAAAQAQGDTIVRISEEAAQKLKLGERELRRRKARRVKGVAGH
jgi:hypothetical protein